MSDIFNEVDEEVRRERLNKLWERYRNYILAAAFAVVAAVALYRVYDTWQNRLAGQASAAYDSAARLSDGLQHDESEAAFAKVANDGTSGYQQLARLRAAAELAERDPKAAVAAYDAIAKDYAGQPSIAQLAAVRAGFLLVDSAPFDEMTSRLEALAQSSGIYRHSARELLAFSAYRTGDVAAARKWSDAAKFDPEVPNGIRSRMDMIASLIPEPGKP